MSETKQTKELIALSNEASDLSKQMEGLVDGVNLTRESVDKFRAQVALLKQTESLLNEVYGILNELPSGIQGQYNKPNPNRYR
jgi:hypothetical protein